MNTMVKVRLKDFEKFHRSKLTRPYVKAGFREIFFTYLFCLCAAPFLFAVLMMLPLIGQLLFLIASSITITYLVVRRSWFITFAAALGFLSFIVPLLISIQAIKMKLEVVLFLLMASAIPFSIFYIMIVAGLSWYLVDQKNEKAGD